MSDFDLVLKAAVLGRYQRDDCPDIQLVEGDEAWKWHFYLDKINKELDEKAEQDALLDGALEEPMPHIYTSNEIVQGITQDVLKELERATGLNGPFKSAHEGWAILFEEVDELWDEVKLKVRDRVNMDVEATQVAAMGIRFMMDVTRRIDV